MASSSTLSSVLTNVTAAVNATNSRMSDSPSAWTTVTAPRIAFLAVFMAFGFAGNLFLIITVCHSHRFRHITFYIFIINLAVVNLCECAFNMSILLASSILNEWTFGDICCSLSGFFLSFVSVETVLGLTILTVDRLIAVRYKDKYDHVVSTPRICIILVFTWCQSFCFSIPIAVDAIPTAVNNYTNSCVVTGEASVIYALFAAVFCFVVPLILMIVMFVKIIRTGYRERVMIRTLISQHSYKDDSVQEPRVKQEIRHSNVTGTACATWLCIQGPYLVTYYFNQVKHSAALDDVTTAAVDYVWYVDLVLLWLRFSYVMVLPIATFTWSKDLWKSFKDLILCRKNNSVEDESFKKSESDSLKLARRLGDEEKPREKAREPAVAPPGGREHRVFQVPVLFATSHGVHIQTASQTDVMEHEGSDGQTSTLRGKKCDVIGSRENLNFEEDTSDYDSSNEVDPFSVSNPVSVKHLESEILTDRKRSISNPEVREKIDTAEKTMVKTIGSSCNGDSGLDLSSGTFLHTGQSINDNGHQDVQKQQEKDRPIVHRTYAFGAIKEKDDNHLDNVTAHGKEKNVNEADVVENSPDKQTKESANEEFETTTDKVLTVKKKKSLNRGPSDSPAQRRKKKKRKEKNLDNISNASDLSCTTLPLRPPPRLAPIAAPGGLKRPGSSCSSQCSFGDNNGDSAQCVHVAVLGVERCRECDRSDTASVDNLSLTSFNANRSLVNTHSMLKQVGALDSQVDRNRTDAFDNKREIKCVPEETTITSEIDSFTRGNDRPAHDIDGSAPVTGAAHEVYERLSEGETKSEHRQTQQRNAEARRKRRERLTAPGVLNDSKGYRRLLPETP